MTAVVTYVKVKKNQVIMVASATKSNNDDDADDQDPFAVFGDDGDDDGGADNDEGDDAHRHKTATTTNSSSPIAPSQLLRDPSCGAMVFHHGTEQALWHFVKNEFEAKKDRNNHENTLDDSNTDNTIAEIQIKKCEMILNLVDNFCMMRHWMMHVGNEKGDVLRNFLRKGYEEWMENHLRQQQSKQDRPYNVVELGTYCGYSLLLMAKTLLELVLSQSLMSRNASVTFHIYTVDANPEHVKVAKQMMKLAGITDYVTFLLVDDSSDNPDQLSQILQKAINNNDIQHQQQAQQQRIVDFLFIDHVKELYHNDLVQLERTQLVRCGSYVCADNVVVFHDVLQEGYRKHVAKLAADGVVKTSLVKTNLEYVNEETCLNEKNNYQDGLGKDG